MKMIVTVANCNAFEIILKVSRKCRYMLIMELLDKVAPPVIISQVKATNAAFILPVP
jgi:hypothetical protein